MRGGLGTGLTGGGEGGVGGLAGQVFILHWQVDDKFWKLMQSMRAEWLSFALCQQSSCGKRLIVTLPLLVC